MYIYIYIYIYRERERERERERGEMKMYCLESRSRGISHMKYVKGRRTGLVTFYVKTAFYNGLLKERYMGG